MYSVFHVLNIRESKLVYRGNRSSLKRCRYKIRTIHFWSAFLVTYTHLLQSVKDIFLLSYIHFPFLPHFLHTAFQTELKILGRQILRYSFDHISRKNRLKTEKLTDKGLKT